MKTRNSTIGALALLVALGVTVDAHADVIWPALVTAPRLLSVPVLMLGLVVEAAALKAYFQHSWSQAGTRALIVNALSALLGTVLIPLSGLVWEFGPGQLVNRAFDVGTFNPVSWAATLIFAATISTLIEGATLQRFFAVKFDTRRWLIWLAANFVSTAVAVASVFLSSEFDANYRPWLF
ncbi:hypothetical protein [Candidatus Viadribacter manganicus]|uniref:Uncharacterized protein n=1 Tax=Candidatus Viadribacter manganicus TaxID=1759059 RepID=A0A1B1AMK7_9PROT|nr:hypothetical protein [Candidatus Viadribacter manganicus]ANP47781.1 hypothetical protein ATE48_18700 [Candidatus Viadribacter manganicus]